MPVSYVPHFPLNHEGTSSFNISDSPESQPGQDETGVGGPCHNSARPAETSPPWPEHPQHSESTPVMTK